MGFLHPHSTTTTNILFEYYSTLPLMAFGIELNHSSYAQPLSKPRQDSHLHSYGAICMFVHFYFHFIVIIWIFYDISQKKREKKHNWKYMYVMLSICMQRDRKWILNYFFVKCDCGWFQYPMCPCHWIRLVVRWRMVGILLWVMLWILCIVIYAIALKI